MPVMKAKLPSGAVIKVRSLKGAEIDKYANSDKIAKADPMSVQLLIDCAEVEDLGPAYAGEPKDFDFRDLLTGDHMAAILAVIIETMGPIVEYNMECAECGAKFMHDLNLAGLETEKYDEEVCEKNAAGELIKIRPFGADGVEIGFKPMTVRDSEKFLKSAKGKKKEERDTVTSILAQRIKHVEDMDVRSYSVLSKWLKEMDYYDFLDLQESIAEYDGGVKVSDHVECTDCGADLGETEFPLDPPRALQPSKRARGLNRSWKKKMKDHPDGFHCQVLTTSQD